MSDVREPAVPRPTLRRSALLGLGVPVVATVLGWWQLTGWRDELPAQVAIHFGADGAADGFVAVGTLPWLLLAAPLTALLLWAPVAYVSRNEPVGVRLAAATSAGTGVFVLALVLLLTRAQRGLASAADHGVGGWPIVLALATGLVVGAAVAAACPVAPSPSVPGAPGPDVPRIAVDDAEQVAWVGQSRMSRWVLVVLTAVLGAAVTVAWVVGGTVAGLPVALVAVLVLVLLGLLASRPVAVRVDRFGLHVRGPLARRGAEVPLAEIAVAETIHVPLLNSFGGYGYRIGPQGAGWILRPGAALRVVRGDGSRVVVTIDGAAEAAATVNTLLDRDRGPRQI